MRESLRLAGARVVVGFAGTGPPADLEHLVRSYGVGAVLLGAHNVERPEQAAELVRELQSWARRAGHELPLLVAAVQEGGAVALPPPWTAWPAPRELGRAGDEELARRMGAALAVELAACGIRWNLAPSADVDTLGDPETAARCLGDDPDRVGRLASALVEGLQRGGVAACAGHFPGSAGVRAAAAGLPRAEQSRSQIEEVGLRPFRSVIGAGVAAVLAGHVLFPELDEELPAALSPAVLGLLRERLRHDGVVLCDDLSTPALAQRWRPRQAAVLAARAGCDLLLVRSDPAAQVEAIEALVHAQEAGELPWKAMEAAAGRVRRLKESVLLPYADPAARAAREAAGRPEHVALALQIAERAGIRA